MTCTICNVLHGWLRGQKNKQQNNVPNSKNIAAAGYQGPVKIELLKDVGLVVGLVDLGHFFWGGGRGMG